MAEQSQQVDTAVLQRLQRRQNAVLSKLGSLQLRLNQLQRASDLPYDTSKLSLSEFQRIESKQDSIFERLLKIAGEIDQTAKRQNIQLPARNDVDSMIQSMADNLAKRQQRSLNQLKILGNAAKSIQEMQMTPHLKSLIESKDDETRNEEKDDEIIKSSKPSKPTKFDSFKSRIYDLESVTECLRVQCQRMDIQQKGTLTVDQMTNILDTVSMLDIDGSVQSEKHIQLVLNEMSIDSKTNYNQFLDLIVDGERTESMENALSWNELRYNLVGNGRIEGRVRILYRYDGWPEPQSFLVSSMETECKHQLSVQEVLNALKERTPTPVDFHELRFASKLSQSK